MTSTEHPTRLLADLVAQDPGRPRITQYGADGERVELSARVLGTWVAKTANLLVDEADLGAGGHVLLDLPPHWRALVWALGTWSADGTVRLPDAADGTGPVDGADDLDLVVTDRPGDHPSTTSGAGAQLVAVALPALARTADGPLPAGAIDYAAEVMVHGDVFAPVPAAAAQPALRSRGGTTPWPALADRATSLAAASGWSASTRVLLGIDRAARSDRPDALRRLLEVALAVLAVGGSLVLVMDDLPADRLDHLASTEGVTDRLG